MNSDSVTPEDISDKEALAWLDGHCTSIRISNDAGQYVGSWQVPKGILAAAKTAMARITEGERADSTFKKMET